MLLITHREDVAKIAYKTFLVFAGFIVKEKNQTKFAIILKITVYLAKPMYTQMREMETL
ncbi:MAG: hypothetical protein ACUVUG_03215 [Candidatus Aminicenantia bacterium]